MSLPATWLIIANVVMYVVVAVSGGEWLNIDGAVLARWGANIGALTIGHEWWRLVTAMFLHGGLLHLAVNMVSLLVLGLTAHLRLGGPAFLVAYFASGIAGSLMSLAVHDNRLSVGASGAIFGLAGALFASTFARAPELTPELAPESREATKDARIQLLKVLGFNLVFGAVSPGIDNAAHIGGLIGGLVMGAALTAGGDSLRHPASRRVAAVAVGSAVFLVACGAALERASTREPGSYAEYKEAVSSAENERHAKDARRSRAEAQEASVAPLEQGVRAHPDSADLILSLAQALAVSGQTDSARRVLQAGVNHLPERPDVWLALGALNLNLREYDNAVAAFEAAARLDPENQALTHDLGIARLGLASHRLAIGDTGGAHRALEAIIASGTAPESTRARALLDSLRHQD